MELKRLAVIKQHVRNLLPLLIELRIDVLVITLPNFLYPGGESKLVSSILAVIFPSSSIVVTPSTAESQPLMFPKVILAFSTWKSGISVKNNNK